MLRFKSRAMASPFWEVPTLRPPKRCTSLVRAAVRTHLWEHFGPNATMAPYQRLKAAPVPASLHGAIVANHNIGDHRGDDAGIIFVGMAMAQV